MNTNFSKISAGVFLSLSCAAASAQFSSSFEVSEPSFQWLAFFGTSIFRPASDTTAFDVINPLAPPASGDRYLELSGVNTGIYRLSGLRLDTSKTYRLDAAIGNSKVVGDDLHWSLQIWADSDGSGIFEGSAPGHDKFIGQNYGTNLGALAAPNGGWVRNSFTFSGSDFQSLAGQQLVVFLNNFSSGTSFYDSVSISVVPEPSTSLMVLAGVLALVGWRRCVDRESSVSER